MIAALNFFLLEILAKYSEHFARAGEFNYLIVNRSISLSLEREIYVLLLGAAESDRKHCHRTPTWK